MKSQLGTGFLECWPDLPVEIQRLARKNYQLWKSNHRHPSLRFEEKLPGVWGVRVGAHHRALGRLREDTIVWFWIGSHAEYDAILRRR